MTDHAMRGWAPRALRVLAAVLVGAVAAGCGVGLAVVSFEWSSWAPALVSLALVVAGAVLYRHSDEVILRGIGIGLIAGGVLTVPLWSFFPVDTGGGLESRAPS